MHEVCCYRFVFEAESGSLLPLEAAGGKTPIRVPPSGQVKFIPSGHRRERRGQSAKQTSEGYKNVFSFWTLSGLANLVSRCFADLFWWALITGKPYNKDPVEMLQIWNIPKMFLHVSSFGMCKITWNTLNEQIPVLELEFNKKPSKTKTKYAQL